MANTSDLLAQMEDLDEILANAALAATDNATRDRAVRALNRAQDFFESIVAQNSDFLTDVDDSVTQTVDQEFSAAPIRTLRIDSLWFLDASDSLPRYEVIPERTPGGHREGRSWPVFDVSQSSSGRPEKYWWARGSNRVYWDRLPDAANNIRFVGFFGAADMTISPDSTFAYEDNLIVPFAQVAAEIFRFRRRDNWEELRQVALQNFEPVFRAMGLSWQHGRGNIRGHYPSW